MSSSTLCRLCVSESTEFLDMCKLYYGETPAIKYIVEVLDIKVDSENTKLSMCSDCNTALSNFHSFCTMVREAQYKYKALIKTQNPLMYLTVYPLKEEFVDDGCCEFNKTPLNIGDTVKCKKEDSADYLDNVPATSNETDVWSPGETSDNFSDTEILKPHNKNTKSKHNKTLHKSKTNHSEGRSKKKQKRSTKQFMRKQMATKTMFSKYKLDEICCGKEWRLSEEQKEEMLSLYVDMECNMCEETQFSTYSQLEQHSIMEHGTQPTLTCCQTPAEGRVALETHILFRHILKRDLPRTYKHVDCPVCHKSVRTAILKEHLATHLPHDKREFQCEQCHLGFPVKARLMNHILSKHSGTTLPCEDCGKTFNTPTRLKFHQKNVHGPAKKNHLCPECGKEIKTLSNFRNHLESHNGVAERVKCHMCDAVVKRACLSSHMRSHDPKKHKQCPHCPYKAFKIREHIRRVHEKVKPFMCSFCPMTFYKEKPMQDHIASRHTGIPGYACEFCNKTFMSSGNYHSHCKRMHPTQLAEKKMRRANEINTGDIRDSKMLETKKKTILEGAEADQIIKNVQNITKSSNKCVKK